MISPTSFDLFHRCQRAWWYRYVGRVVTPKGPALAHGSAVHAAIETYLTTGQWPDGDSPAILQARRAQGTLDTLPDGLVEVNVEADLTTYGGIDTLRGKCDWTTADIGGGVGGPSVVDHKTTANPDYWQTPAQLARNPQLLAYAGALYPGQDVHVAHHYVPPAPHEPVIVWSYADADTIREVLGAFAETTVEIARVRPLATPEEAPANPKGCWAYGGCDYGGICTAAPASLRDRINRKNGGNMDNTPKELTPTQRALRARLGLGPTETPTEPPAAVEKAVSVDPSPTEDVAPPDAPKRKRKAPAETLAEAHAAGGRSLTVFVGCIPANGGTTLEEWAPAAFAAAALDGKDDHGHYLLDHGHYLLVPFAKGPLRVAAAIQTAIRTGLLVQPDRLVIPSDHPVAAALVPCLGGEVVRGVR